MNIAAIVFGLLLLLLWLFWVFAWPTIKRETASKMRLQLHQLKHGKCPTCQAIKAGSGMLGIEVARIATTKSEHLCPEADPSCLEPMIISWQEQVEWWES